MSRPGALFYKALEDGMEVVVYPMAYGKGRLCYGPQGWPEYDRAYCYPHASTAIKAAQVWDGQGDPPVGWVRALDGSGRRMPSISRVLR